MANAVTCRRESALALWLVAILVVTTLAVFARVVFQCDFINYDDPEYVTDNEHVLKGMTMTGVQWAFTSGEANNWHPLTWLSHMLDVTMFGLHPWGHHLTSLLLHAANAGLLFWLLRGMTGAHWRSAFVAALFALHPLHVESVAWVAERKDVLSGFFGMLALIFYTRFVQKGETRVLTSGFYWLSLICFALGLMSKPMLVTWPFVMLLLDFWPLKRFPASGFRLQLFLEKLPFFTLSAASCVITVVVQKQGGAVRTLQVFSALNRLENALVAYVRYLGKTFWPAELAIFYPHPGHWPLGWLIGAAVLLAGVTGLAVWLTRRAPFIAVGWLWYLGTLVPVIGLIQVGHQSMADRYSYLPLIGIFILLVWGAAALVRHWRFAKLPVMLASILVLVICAAATTQQLGYWRDSEKLYRHALAVTKNNQVAANNLGTVLLKQGKTDEAIGLFREALRADTNFMDAYNNLGAALIDMGEAKTAIPYLRGLVQAAPEHAEGQNNLGIALANTEQFDEAIVHFRESLRLSPAQANTHFNLGNALAIQRQFEEAAAEYTEALRLNPDLAPAHFSLGSVLTELGRRTEAGQHLREALRLQPDNAQIRQALDNLEKVAP